MRTRGERLRQARRRLYKSARAAAAAMGLPPATYGAHERAETPGGRDYGPEDAKRYGRRFKVAPEWLLTGAGDGLKPVDGAFEAEAPNEAGASTVRLVGYVGAGAAAHFYAVAQGDLDAVPDPDGTSKTTVAVEVRGDSLGPLFDRWLVYYDDVRSPVTSDMIGKLCVVGLPDDRVLVKKIKYGGKKGHYDLISATQDDTLRDVAIDWAAKVTVMTPR